MTMVAAWVALAFTAAGDVVGASWRRVDGAVADRIASVSWDGPLMVGVGTRGLVCTATDGKSWTNRFQVVQADLKAVVWGGSQYVAVGNDGAMLRSTNGIDWQRVEMPADYDFAGVTWTGSKFIALDNQYFISTSTDGVTWNRVQATTYAGNGIEHFDGATYLRYSSGIARSTDLVNWTPVWSDGALAKIRKLNGRLFSLGGSNAILSSVDGITWTQTTKTGPSISQNLTDVEWNGACYLAVGTSSYVWRSLDGLTWTAEHTVANDATYVKWINGEFVTANGPRTVQTSVDGREWIKAKDHIQGEATVWTGSRFITVGQFGRITTSEDFVTWTSRDTGVYSNLWSVVWTGSFALVGGNDGVLLKSSDGIVWTQVMQGTFSGTVTVVWTGTQYYAFHGSGTHVSPDGISWTSISSSMASYAFGTRWLRGMFITVSYDGSIHTSLDGVTWTLQNSGTTSWLNAVEATDEGFLAGGRNGVLLASPDGATWTPRTSPVKTVDALAYCFGRWFLASGEGVYQSVDGVSWSKVAGVKTPSSGPGKLVWTGSELVCTGFDARTADGTTWMQVERPIALPDFNAVAKGGDGYVAVGDAGVIWYSPNGYAWQPAASPTTSNLVAIAGRPGRWVAVGNAGTIVTSSDGIAWTQANSGTSNKLLDLAWNGQRFAVVGELGTILSSVDGQNWSPCVTGNTTSTIGNIEAMGSAFKAFAGSGQVFESPDGVTWMQVDAPSLTGIVWNGTSYVAISRGVETYANVFSADGQQWARYPMGTTKFITGLCWTGSLYVACGTSGTILTSPDAITWTPRVSGTTGWLQAVTWSGAQLVAVGEGTPFLSSPDGITWTASSGPSGNYEDVAWADGRYVAVGDVTASATSTNGVNWQSMTGSMGFDMRTVDKVGSVFLAGGTSLSSTTATAWVSAGDFDPAREFYDFEWNGNVVYATSTKGVYLFQPSPTKPGKWDTTLVHASPWLDNMAHHGNEFMAVGVSGTVVVSQDGTTWQTVRGGREYPFASTAWNGSHFAGVADNRIQASPDGAAWSSPVSPIAPSRTGYVLSEVVWTGSRFLAMGGLGNVIQAGPDGTNWSNVGSAAWNPYNVSGIAGDDHFLVAVGPDGLIAVSDGSGEAAGDYHAWISAQDPDDGSEAPLQDANGDGISNVMAYALGIPAVGMVTPGERAALPAVSFDAGGAVLTFDLRESYRPGASYFVEASSDMRDGSWQTLQQYTAGWASGAGSASVTEAPLPGGGVRITVRNFPGLQEGGGFFRLRAVLP